MISSKMDRSVGRYIRSSSNLHSQGGSKNNACSGPRLKSSCDAATGGASCVIENPSLLRCVVSPRAHAWHAAQRAAAFAQTDTQTARRACALVGAREGDSVWTGLSSEVQRVCGQRVKHRFRIGTSSAFANAPLKISSAPPPSPGPQSLASPSARSARPRDGSTRRDGRRRR